MGIEPTSRAATARDNGFEDRKRHQPPSASGDIVAEDRGGAEAPPGAGLSRRRMGAATGVPAPEELPVMVAKPEGRVARLR